METKKYYVVKFAGVFGFIKPFSAIRDKRIYSQHYLTPSILNGIEQKLFPEKLNQESVSSIVAHKLQSSGMSIQKETIHAKQIKKQSSFSVVERGILLYPVLLIAFDDQSYAERAHKQCISLSRSEDILFPEDLFETSPEEFDLIPGIEFKESEDGFLVGFNRYKNFQEMKIVLNIR